MRPSSNSYVAWPKHRIVMTRTLLNKRLPWKEPYTRKGIKTESILDLMDEARVTKSLFRQLS